MDPSILNTFNQVSASDRLNSPSHSALHNTVSSALGQVEAFIGKVGSMGSYIQGTLLYDIRSSNSNGGGHVQSANKGGTGQTTYTKGDLLVATNSSTISKLAVGSDGQALIADSSVAGGVKWGSAGSKIFATASIISVLSGVETSVISTNLSASTLGTNNAIKTQSFIRVERLIGSDSSIYARVQYGGATVSSVILRASGALAGSVMGVFSHTMIGSRKCV